MSDMLVRLFDLSESECCALEETLRGKGIYLKRAMIPDTGRICTFVREHFGEGWSHEAAAGIMRNGCWIAVKDKKVVGFACFDATMLDFFGPIGVLEEMRGNDIGKALLLKCLLSMREKGYAYAVIGWVGPAKFYEKCVGAFIIPDPAAKNGPRSYHNMVQFDEPY